MTMHLCSTSYVDHDNNPIRRVQFSFDKMQSVLNISMWGLPRYNNLPAVGDGLGGGKAVEDELKGEEKQKQEKRTFDYQVLCLLLLCKFEKDVLLILLQEVRMILWQVFV